MPEVVTLANRRRGHANAARSDILRERVQDIIGGQLGGRNGVAEEENARLMFTRTAVRLSKNLSRTWSDNTFPLESCALNSLQVLLGEKVTVVKGRATTGVNDGWVLNIWDATCAYYARTPLFQQENNSCRDIATDITDDEIAELNGGGPKFIAESPKEKIKSLAVRVLDAYISRNDEQMMQLIVDIENAELA